MFLTINNNCEVHFEEYSPFEQRGLTGYFVLPDIKIRDILIYYKGGTLQDAMIMDICLSMLPDHIKIDEIMRGTKIGYNVVRDICSGKQT